MEHGLNHTFYEAEYILLRHIMGPCLVLTFLPSYRFQRIYSMNILCLGLEALGVLWQSVLVVLKRQTTEKIDVIQYKSFVNFIPSFS